MNKAILVGRLTKDPELKTTASGVSVCSFTIAINRRFRNAEGNYDADFINCVAWRKQAENIAKYCVKGTQVAAEGRIQTRSYEFIMDLYTRDIIAYKISKRMDNKLVMDTLNEAIRKQKDVHGVILHSDQGFQYTSNEYKAICEANGIIISMSPKGSPVDNSPIERFHSSLKRETLKSYNITSLKEYVDLVKEWILFYNTKRIRLN